VNYHFDFSFLDGKVGALLGGLKITLELTLVSNLLGLTFGFLLCLTTLNRWAIVRWPARMFIEFFRCTPALLQIVWFFYCIPMMFDFFIGPLTLGIIALGLNLTAFNAEATAPVCRRCRRSISTLASRLACAPGNARSTWCCLRRCAARRPSS